MPGKDALLVLTLEAERGKDRNAQRFRRLMHRRLLQLHATACGARRLAVAGHHIMPLPHDFHEGRHGEIGRTHEDDAKCHALLPKIWAGPRWPGKCERPAMGRLPCQDLPVVRACFWNFFTTRSRFSFDR